MLELTPCRSTLKYTSRNLLFASWSFCVKFVGYTTIPSTLTMEQCYSNPYHNSEGNCYAKQHVSLVGYQAGVDNRCCNEKLSPNCGGNVGTECGQFALFFSIIRRCQPALSTNVPRSPDCNTIESLHA